MKINKKLIANLTASFVFLSSNINPAYSLAEDLIDFEEITINEHKEEQLDQVKTVDFEKEEFRELLVHILNTESNRIEGTTFKEDPTTYKPTKEDIELLKVFKIPYMDNLDLSNITKLEGLEHAKNLTELKVSKSNLPNLQDIKSISNLDKLEKIEIDSSKVDLSPLLSLPNLKELSFTFSDIDSLEAIRGIEHLESVDMNYTEIKDISPLYSSKNLKSLTAYECEIDNIEGIEQLSELRKLDLYSNNITSIEGLENLDKLETLVISHNNIEDISPISNLYNLKKFDMEKNKVTDMTPIEKLINLEEVTIRGNKVRSAEAFKDLINLKYLHLYENRIEDINCLDRLVNLEEFNISKNQIEDISVVNNFKKMHTFQARQNKITDVSFIDYLKNNGALKVVNVSENNIKDLSSLDKFAKENTVDIDSSMTVVIDNQKSFINLEKPEYEIKDNKYYIEIDNPIKLIDGSYGKIIEDTADFQAIYKTEKVNNDRLILVIDKDKIEHNTFKLYSQFNYPEEVPGISKEWDFTSEGLVEVINDKGFDFNGDLIFNINLNNNIEEEYEYREVEFGSDDLRKFIVKSLNNDENRYFGNPFKEDPETYNPTYYDMKALKTIDVSICDDFDFTNITNLKGLESAIYLLDLNFSTGYVDNIENLDNLKRLQTLNLSNNNIDDISSLKELRQLREINLANTPVDNLSPLKNLKLLNYVDITGCNISSRFNIDEAVNIVGLVKSEENKEVLDPGKPITNIETNIKNQDEDKEDDKDKIEDGDKIEEDNRNSFKDISNSHWAYQAIENLASKNIITGYSDKSFKPNKDMTRAEFATIIDRVFDFNLEELSTSFKDVDKNSWYFESVTKLKELGIVEGNNEGNFLPENSITREEMLKIFIKSIEIENKVLTKEGSLDFNDITDISDWAMDSVAKAVDLKLIEGYADNTIRPKNNITRAEISIIIDRFLTLR